MAYTWQSFWLLMTGDACNSFIIYYAPSWLAIHASGDIYETENVIDCNELPEVSACIL